jgi:large subunit ribosomal protein L25
MDLRQALSSEYGSRILLRLKVEGEAGEPTHAVVKAVQKHPVRHDMLHADLLAVDKDRPVIMRVPVAAAAGTPFGVKNQGGVLEWMRRDVILRVLPEKIPSRIELDVTDLRLGQSIKAGQVAGDAWTLAMDADEPICHVIATRMSLEVEEPEAEEGEEAEGEAGEAGEAEASGEESQG